MDSVARLLIDLYRLRANIWLEEDGRLRYCAPAGAITATTKELLRERKAEIISFLRRSESLPLLRDTISVDLLREQPALAHAEILRRGREPQQQPAAPYWEILRLRKPWGLSEFSCNLRDRTLVLHIALRAGSSIRCPDCDSPMSVHSSGLRRWWKHSSEDLNIVVCGEIPLFNCTTHGARSPPISWLTPEFRVCGPVCRHSTESLVARVMQRGKGQFWRLRYADTVRLLRPLGDVWRSRRVITATTAACSVAPARVVLPLDIDPPFKTYQCFGAHPLGIVGAATDISPLLASHYINLSCNSTLADGTIGVTIVPRRTVGHFVAAGQCELLDVGDESLFKFSHSHRLVRLLIDRIQEGWYVLLHVNEYYFPNHQAYMEEDCLHDCLAFGFDTTRACFRVAMYLKSGQYGATEVSFADMCKALTLHGSNLLLGGAICYRPLALFVKPRINVQFRLDTVAARCHLADYLTSNPPDVVLYARDKLKYAGDWEMTFGYPTKTRRYGLQAFADIVCHISNLIASGSQVEMRATRALWEHKRIMHSNIAMWTREAAGADGNVRLYAEVVKWARELHFMCFVYNRSGDGIARLKAHFDRFVSVIEAEKEVLSESLCDLAAR